MSNVIKADFGGHTGEEIQYYELHADEPYDAVFVSVHKEGIELIQEDGEEAHEIFVTDEQLASILLIIGIEQNKSEGETPYVLN